MEPQRACRHQQPPGVDAPQEEGIDRHRSDRDTPSSAGMLGPSGYSRKPFVPRSATPRSPDRGRWPPRARSAITRERHNRRPPRDSTDEPREQRDAWRHDSSAGRPRTRRRSREPMAARTGRVDAVRRPAGPGPRSFGGSRSRAARERGGNREQQVDEQTPGRDDAAMPPSSRPTAEPPAAIAPKMPNDDPRSAGSVNVVRAATRAERRTSSGPGDARTDQHADNRRQATNHEAAAKPAVPEKVRVRTCHRGARRTARRRVSA